MQTEQEPEKGHRVFAALYDRITAPTERRFLLPLRRGLRRLEGDVLEIGVGTGANLPYYAPTARVVGVEPDPFMLRRAEAKLRALDRPNITLRQASAEALPFPDQSFDHVVGTLVLCTVDDPARALAEIERVLRPGGYFHFVEHVRGEGRPGRVQDFMQPLWSRMSGGCRPNRRTEASIEEAGFRVQQLDQRMLPLGMPLIAGSASPGTRAAAS